MTFQILADWINLVNEYGRNSGVARDFLEVNAGNVEFIRLASVSDSLRDMFDSDLPTMEDR